MQSMKGATSLLGSMNRSMNLPALQRIAMEFEKENDIMDQRQEMMDDAIDDVTGLEDEEEGEEVVREVLDEIGVDLGMAVCAPFFWGVGGRGMGGRWVTQKLTGCGVRWARRRVGFRRPRWRMGGSRRRLGGVEGVGVRMMMICRLGLIACGGDVWEGLRVMKVWCIVADLVDSCWGITHEMLLGRRRACRRSGFTRGLSVVLLAVRVQSGLVRRRRRPLVISMQLEKNARSKAYFPGIDIQLRQAFSSKP